MAQPPASSILGNTAAIAGLRTQIGHLATFDTVKNPRVPTVLLQGETGTGKGLVARVIHASGGRAAGPFIDVNCGAIPETMVEAELFGFEAGAFTDAKRAKPGLFEAASTGTLFLDEVDALPPAVQSKLLKAIEEKSVRRLGAIAAHQVDVKLIAATQRDLKDLVAHGSFRADLYYRLALVILDIPSLRARREDILYLAGHFLEEHAAAHGLVAKRLDDGARAWLLAHDWPGNVRELSHLIERVTLLCLEPDVDREMLERLRVPVAAPVARTRPAKPPSMPSSEEYVELPSGAEAEEATRITEALARAGGNVVGAARLLGIGRNALRYRMRRLAIERPRLHEVGGVESRGRREIGRRAGTTGAVQAPTGSPAVVPSWEQKSVAVLAIDLVFPEPAAGSIAHEPWTVASRWERMIEDRIAGFGGVFLRRSPSRLAAAFGIPRALEQMPQRAVQAALAIQRLLAEEPRPADHDPRPELRMAVHLGALQVDAAADDPMARLRAVGDTLALPERLLGHAGAGEILVSAQVARRVEAVCDLRARDLQIGANGAERLRVSAVVGRRLRPTTTEGVSPGMQSWFVGRERELALLREAFQSAVDGAGQVAFVVGEAGIGKSRLLGEFRRSLQGEPHLWLESRCASYATTTAFLPLIDGLRRYFGIDDRDEEAGAAMKIQHGVAELGDDLAWTLPFVRQVLSVQAGDAEVAALDSASRRSEIFRALKALTLRLAERQPLVLVVEDVHWIDPASEEYLAFIADAIPATRALLVCSHRTGYRHPFGERSYHVRVTLRPLSSGEMAEITGSLLGTASLPPEVRQLIAEKAEGNPFFVEEVTKSLLEDGSLRRVDDTIVLVRELAEIAVPSTIQDVLIARIDRLPDASRQAIQVASVIGREFALRLLERIAESGAHVRTHVDELRSLELIYEKVTDPELAYMFKHALTHDVAYESVLLERRKALHRIIGLAIEELYADRLSEFYETLAHHFSRGEDWERALLYHERAAAKAAENFANRAVIAHCRHALAIADHLKDAVTPERRRQLEEAIGLSAFYVSEYATSAEAFTRGASQAATPEPCALDLANAALSHLWGHAYDAARQTSDEALALAHQHGIKAAEAFALNVQGWQDGITKGDMAGWERCLLAALAAGEAAGSEAAVAFTRFQLAMLAEWTGDYRKAVTLSEQVIASGRRLRLAHLVVWPAWFLGKAWCCLGEYGSAIARLTEAYEVCDRLGDRAWKARMLNTLGWCFAEIGSHAHAREHNERAAAVARVIGDAEAVANAEINLAGNHLALGDIARARGYVEPILATLAQPGDPWMRWRFSLHATDVLGRIELAESSPERAVALADDEEAGVARHHVPKVGVRAGLLRGAALLALERDGEAEAALTTAVAGADRISYPRGAWQGLGLLAELKRRAGALTEAEGYVTRQRALVERLALSLREPELRQQLITFSAAVRTDR